MTLAFLVGWMSQTVLAQSLSTPSIDQSISLKSISNPRISPDGRYVAYQVARTNWEENAYETDIWIGVTSSDEIYQLTYAKKSSTSPTWSPDGQRLAFLSDRDGKNQIYLIRPNGGEARQFTQCESGVNSLKWSPDGRFMAYTSPEPETKAMKDRKEKYGDYEVVQSEYTMTHLWIIPTQRDDTARFAVPKRLTKGSSFTVNNFSWSPDSKLIAFSAQQDPDLGSSSTADIYVLNLADTTCRKIVDTPGPDSNPCWSPDGKNIAYETANGREFFFYVNGVIAIVSAEGGKPRVLSEALDEDASLLGWSNEGILLSALQKTNAHLFCLSTTTKKIERISGPDAFVLSQCSFTSDFKQAAFVGAEPNRYSEIYVTTLKPFAPKQLTRLGEQIKDFKVATREVIEWKSTDGTLIQGVLIKPAEFDPLRKYPLLVLIHGGPTGVDRPTVTADRNYPVERFVAKGCIVLRPNYRGSGGYGEKFRSLNVRNLGIGDYWDVISGVDYLVLKGMVDRDRVGAMGWSQGGYISAYITTYSDRFRAVSVGAGISDWMTYYVNTDIYPFTRQYLKATPWDDPDIYRKTSPISNIKRARTPTLIQHGENDKRVPIPNAYELYRALRDRDIPVKMIVYKGFGHGITKPKQMRSVMEENERWFGKWIWGEN
ncbi:S9 family peptidase [bacterium]|nr:MAG: S9 family peptidase [bacterium]